MKKMSHSGKEIIALFALFIISTIVFFGRGSEEAMGVIHLYFFLHFIYSFVKIDIIEEDSEGASYKIAKLTQRNEALERYIIQLEEELEKAQNNSQQ